jgi:hypothetical protein
MFADLLRTSVKRKIEDEIYKVQLSKCKIYTLNETAINFYSC